MYERRKVGTDREGKGEGRKRSGRRGKRREGGRDNFLNFLTVGSK